MEFIEATPKENINLISNYVPLTFYKSVVLQFLFLVK